MSKSIHLFYGEEDFLIEEKVNALKSKIANPSLNVEVLDGENLSLEVFSSALCTQPLLGGEKLIIVRDSKVNSENQGEIISVLENLPPGVKVIFWAASVDRRSKFFRWVDEQGEVTEFKTFAPWETQELINWIKRRVSAGGRRMSEAGARRLIEISGNNLRVLANEADKLITYIGEREEIREEDVQRLASPGEISAFALLDALREKNLKKSLSLFQVLLKNREDLFQLIGLLAMQYRLMLQIKSLKERDPNSIARATGGSPYFIRKCLENINHFTLDGLKRSLESLLETSLKLKTGEQQAVVFELLLTSLCEN